MGAVLAGIDPSKPLDALRVDPTFASLDDAALQHVAGRVKCFAMKPRERLESFVDLDDVERMYFVLEGQVGVVRPRVQVTGESARHMLPNPKDEFLMSFSVGDVFSDAYLAEHGPDESANVTCRSIVRTVLASIRRADLLELMRNRPEWAKVVESKIDAAREQYQRHRTPRLRVVQDFFHQHNYSYASTLKVIDLAECIGCDGCERACASRHGLPRLRRKGPALGRLGFAVSCRTCLDHRCLPACGFDALDMKEDELRIDNMKCVGCAACFSACPNDVITMHEKPYTLADFPKPMPQTDLSGRTNVPGVYLVGEASGAALIKVAINGGRTAVEGVLEELGQPGTPDDPVVDLIIVGAGPAGLSASLMAMELGLTFKVFDKGHFATTIQSYPRNKVVMAEPAHIPKYGKLWLEDTTKEQLIDMWKDIIEKTGLPIQSHEPVAKVEPGEGAIQVTTSKGVYQARRVVLATGTRGSPRKLGVEGEAEPRVVYTLTDPDDFKGRRVLVVGGGDSAVEAAMSMADTGPETKVTLSYRRDAFGRIKPRNKSRLEEYEQEGKLRVILSSTVKGLEPAAVQLAVGDDMTTIENDVVLAMLGAEPPTKFFKSIGIEILEPGSPEMAALAKSRGDRRFANKCDHCAGFDDQACISACPTGAIIEIPPTDLFAEVREAARRDALQEEPFDDGMRGESSRGVWALSAVALAALIAVLVGAECFLRRMTPDWSVQALWHRLNGIDAPVMFRSGVGLGYNLGIIGTTLMGLTALYPLHSRLGWLRRVAKTKAWLGAHIVAGLMGPVFVTFHTSMKLDRWPSVAFWLMWLVVFSGAVGRYIYPHVRATHGLKDLSTTEASEGLAEKLRSERRSERLLLTWRYGHIVITVLMFAVAIGHIATALLFGVS